MAGGRCSCTCTVLPRQVHGHGLRNAGLPCSYLCGGDTAGTVTVFYLPTLLLFVVLFFASLLPVRCNLTAGRLVAVAGEEPGTRCSGEISIIFISFESVAIFFISIILKGTKPKVKNRSKVLQKYIT
jgi:hypothetical protein